jgi:hypothetical protein
MPVMVITLGNGERGNGEMEKWGNGEMEKWRNEEMEK